MPYLDDYGGNRYGRRRRTKRGKNDIHSYRCLTCNTLQYFTEREMNRARTPHCKGCGGALQETPASLKKRTGMTVKQYTKIASSGLDDFKPYQCRVCYERFRSSGGLAIHYREAHPDEAGEEF